MDPLLANLSDETFKKLVQEQRPDWAVGAERVGGFQSVQSPEARRFAAPTREEAGKNVWKTFAEDNTPGFWSKAAQMLASMGDASKKKVLEEGPGMWDVVGNWPVTGAVLVGAKGAERVGGKTLYSYLLGKRALESGEDPLKVWEKYKVGTTKEGNYGIELPLKHSVEDALEQFRSVYGNNALKSILLRDIGKGEPRAGFYDPEKRQLYAAGNPNLPITDPNSTRAVVEHELQHGAGHQEGWSPGTRPLNMERPREDRNYWNNADEVRARAAEKRLDPAQREIPFQFDEDVPRMQQLVSKYPQAVAAAVKEKGGMWHPEAVERLAESMFNRMRQLEFTYRDYHGRPNTEHLWRPDRQTWHVEQTNADLTTKNWADRAIRNYLNKYAGTERDPLKDVEVPFGEETKRWEELWDDFIRPREVGAHDLPSTEAPGARPGETIYDVGYQGDNPQAGWANNSIQSYLSHVGDYLRQNVRPEKLQQYDLVRAVKETAANDARVAREMEKAAQASMKDLPVYKDYTQNNPGTLQGMKWVELRAKDEGKLTAEQAKTITGDESGYIANGPDGKPIRNNYTGEIATGRTPEEAHLAGQLAQEGNQMGHCVGGYCEGVASGESRIFSLRDAKGRSHVTIETVPIYEGGERPGTLSEWIRDDIVQIKGKQNRAPVAEYLPYVQDFVKSGKWGEVGDLGNTGLRRNRKTGAYATEEELNKDPNWRFTHDWD